MPRFNVYWILLMSILASVSLDHLPHKPWYFPVATLITMVLVDLGSTFDLVGRIDRGLIRARRKLSGPADPYQLVKED